MHALVDQLEQSLASGHYFLSLFTALSLPDIAGALDSPNGEANGARYAAWYEKWVRPRFAEIAAASLPEDVRKHMKDIESPLTGEACWHFRCSLLHQGSTQHSKSPYARIIFIEPHASTNVVHYCVMDDALCIDLKLFCREVISGVRMWLSETESSDVFKANYEKFVRRHPGGLKPYIVGVPVVG